MERTQAQLGEAIAALRKALGARSRPIANAKKSLDALVAPGALEDLAEIDKHLPGIADADLAGLGLEAERAEVAARLGALHEDLRGRVRMSALGALKRAADTEGIAMSILTERPLVVLLPPLSCAIDLAAGEATIEFAREPVVACKLDDTSVLDARRAALARIRAEAVPSERFFDLLRAAWELAVLARAGAPDDRIDLVDLLGPLALLRAGKPGWRALGEVEPYPRYLLAYQLDRLRRDGMLTRSGRRVELGTATGGSTRDKSNVLFLPTSPTEGQYHLSIRFVPAEGNP